MGKDKSSGYAEVPGLKVKCPAPSDPASLCNHFKSRLDIRQAWYDNEVLQKCPDEGTVHGHDGRFRPFKDAGRQQKEQFICFHAFMSVKADWVNTDKVVFDKVNDIADQCGKIYKSN